VHSRQKCLIVFPEELRNAASNLAVHTLYRILSESYFTDICTVDNLTGIRTGMKLQDFDFLFFSIDYEPNYYNVVKILCETGIEPLTRRRSRPFLIAGGAAVSSNPYPLLPFFNLICIGEAEKIMPEILPKLEDFEADAFGDKEWALIPDRKHSATRVFLKDLKYSESYSAFYYPQSTFKMNLIEVSRSCPTKCRFCLLSYNHLPPRWLPLEKFESATDELPKDTNLGLVGGSVLDHPHITEILEMARKFKTVNPSSVKISTKVFNALKAIKESGLESLTIAPETGSERLRKCLNKNIKNSEILQFLKMIDELEYRNLKLYFMIGLPFENEQDVEETNHILQQAKELFKGQIEVTFSIFVPKPHTPFQYLPLVTKAELKEKLRRIKVPPGIKIDLGSYKGAVKQLLYARAGEELGYAILDEFLTSTPIQKSIDLNKICFDQRFVRTLPFNFINSGVKKSFLETELAKAQKRIATPQCNPGACRTCGIC